MDETDKDQINVQSPYYFIKSHFKEPYEATDYSFTEDGKGIICMTCDEVSRDPDDVLRRYCPTCGKFHRA
jgi:hypothetical protein